jgi:two-component system sensor histidine kinase PilS (NtrC family)
VAKQPQADSSAERKHRRRFALMLGSRAALILALFGSTIFFNLRSGQDILAVTQVLLYCITGAVLVLTAVYLAWLRLAQPPFQVGLHLQVNIIVDVMVATVLVYVTGGVESPFSFLYALPVVNTAVFSPRLGTFLTAGLSCLLLGVLYVLENQGILPLDLEGRLVVKPSAAKVIYRLALNYTMLLIVAWLARYLGEQLQRTGRTLERTRDHLEVQVALNRDIINSLRSGLMAIHPDTRVSLLNPVAETILGWSANDARGRPAVEILPALAPWLGGEASLNAGLYHRVDLEHERPGDGKTIPVGVTLSSLRSPGGDLAGVLVHMQDLTEQQKMEATVKRAEKMAAVGAMAAGMAHEIRDPLASISGSVQMMRSLDQIEDADRRLMEIILRETKRLDTLLADFLAFARPKEPQLRICSLKELIEETVEVYQRGAGAGVAKVECQLDEVRAQVDPDQVRQILWNLLANASEAIDGTGGTVRVSVSEEAGEDGEPRARIEVADQGPGIPADLQERVFEPFVTTKERGSGLGLPTVARIVEAHGGAVHMTCPPEGGTRITIRLPGVTHE